MSARIVCDDYTVFCKNRAAAEHRLADIERAGNCENEHRIEDDEEER